MAVQVGLLCHPGKLKPPSQTPLYTGFIFDTRGIPTLPGFYTDVSRFKTCGTGTHPVRLTSGTGVSQKKEPGSGAEKGSESGAHKTGSTPIFGLQRLF